MSRIAALVLFFLLAAAVAVLPDTEDSNDGQERRGTMASEVGGRIFRMASGATRRRFGLGRFFHRRRRRTRRPMSRHNSISPLPPDEAVQPAELFPRSSIPLQELHTIDKVALLTRAPLLTSFQDMVLPLRARFTTESGPVMLDFSLDDIDVANELLDNTISRVELEYVRLSRCFEVKSFETLDVSHERFSLGNNGDIGFVVYPMDNAMKWVHFHLLFEFGDPVLVSDAILARRMVTIDGTSLLPLRYRSRVDGITRHCSLIGVDDAKLNAIVQSLQQDSEVEFEVLEQPLSRAQLRPTLIRTLPSATWSFVSRNALAKWLHVKAQTSGTLPASALRQGSALLSRFSSLSDREDRYSSKKHENRMLLPVAITTAEGKQVQVLGETFDCLQALLKQQSRGTVLHVVNILPVTLFDVWQENLLQVHSFTVDSSKPLEFIPLPFLQYYAFYLFQDHTVLNMELPFRVVDAGNMKLVTLSEDDEETEVLGRIPRQSMIFRPRCIYHWLYNGFGLLVHPRMSTRSYSIIESDGPSSLVFEQAEVHSSNGL